MVIKVSVIMPSLNVAPYIRQCVESVMNQKLHEIEILCIDAGSTDGTREILAEYAAKDTRIRLIDSPIKSYGYQVNRGIDEAHGEYVGIVETDDFVDTGMYAHLYEMAVRYGNVDVAHCDSVLMRRTGSYEVRRVFGQKYEGRYRKRFANGDLLSRHLSDYNVWDAIYRRIFLLKNKIHCNESHGAAYQDIGFLQQVHTFAESVIYSPSMLYYYRMDRPESSSNQTGWLRFIRQEWQFIEKCGIMHSPQWPLHRGAVYARLLEGFLVELRRTVLRSELHEFWQEDAAWLQKYASAIIKQGLCDEVYLTREEQKMLLLVTKSLSSFEDYVQVEQYFYDRPKKLLRCWSEHEGILFGFGVRGRQVLEQLQKQGCHVIGISDNDASLWGKKVEGVPIFPPGEVPERIGDGDVIICNKYYWEEIRDQLRAIGVPTERVHVFEG